MAKKKKLDDVEAELAALEAELAELEGRSAPKPAPAKAAAPMPEAAPAEPAPEKKSRFGFGRNKGADEAPAEDAAPKKRFGMPALRKPKDEPAPEASAVESAPAEKAPAKPAPVQQPPVAEAPKKRVAEPLPPGDLTHYKRDGSTWIRAIPDHEGPVVRRILDEDGNVVREERATRAELDEVRGVKAERGVGKLFAGATGAMGGAAAKLKSFRFGKKGGDE